MFEELKKYFEKHIDEEILPKVKEVLMSYFGKKMTPAIKEEIKENIFKVISENS